MLRDAPEGVEVRVIAQAILDVLVKDMQHVLLQHRGVVGLYPYLVVDIVHFYPRFLSAALLLY